MASYNDTVLTNNGIAILNRVLAGKCTITFTRAVSSIADYSGKTLSDLQALTSLASIEQNGIATRFDVRSKTMVSIDLLFTNKDLQNSYEIKTIGLYAQASDSSTEVLYAVATASDPETMPAYVDQKLAKFTLTLYTKVGQADKASITITDEGVVKSVNGTFKPDTNGDLSLPFQSQAEANQLRDDLTRLLDSETQNRQNSDNTVLSQAKGYTDTAKSDLTAAINNNYYQKSDIDSKLSAATQGVVKSINGSLKPDTNGDVALSVGDRNIARGNAGGKDWFTITGFNDTINYYVDLVSYPLCNLKAGDKVTFGITMKNEGVTSGTMCFQLQGDVSIWYRDYGHITPIGNVTDFVPNGAEKALTYTITITSGMLNGNSSYFLQIRTDNIPAGGKLLFRYAFVKKGTMATDWTPAPEDTGQAISEVSQTVDAIRADLASEATARNNADNSVLSQAKGYTDTAKSDLTNADASVLNQAKSYTDDAKSDLTAAMNNADASVLGKANAYTDFALRQVWTPTVITTAIDLNNIKACGSYFVQNELGTTSNTPITNAWLFMRVEGVPTRITQTVWKDIDPATQWVRVFTDNSWGNWTQITKAI